MLRLFRIFFAMFCVDYCTAEGGCTTRALLRPGLEPGLTVYGLRPSACVPLPIFPKWQGKELARSGSNSL
jgi:hypothetical protein